MYICIYQHTLIYGERNLQTQTPFWLWLQLKRQTKQVFFRSTATTKIMARMKEKIPR